jgi:hypothetical protein
MTMTTRNPFVSVLSLFLSVFCRLSASGQCCDHTLLMQDSYGDGWNGGTLEVTINGTSMGVFAASGAGSDTVFTVCNGDLLELLYTAGDWENENTYQVYGPSGSVVFADGPDPSVGVVYADTGDCTLISVPGSGPCTAMPIDTVSCVVADNTGALGTAISPGCANYQGADIWYAMPVPASGNVSVSTFTTGGLNDTGIALWTGGSCFGLQAQGCDDDGGPDYFSLALAYELPVGDTLYIQAFGYGGGTGDFELCVSDLGTVTLESSELPIVMINTLGQAIPNDVKIDALMEVKYNGPGNLTYVTDPANEYNGHIGIEVRGASSASYPQQPFAVETRDSLGANYDVSILGMPAENDWVLLSNYNDRSLVRNTLAFTIAQGMGQYAARHSLCEVLVDSAYRGIYVFAEKVKRDSGRVDIAKLTGLENTGDDVTGGYILQQNYWDASNSFQSNFSPIDHPGLDIHFVHEYPDPDTITVPQRDYIAAYVDSLETALYSADFADPAIGFRQYLDVPSFIDYFLVNEVSRSNDGFKKSVFFHKDKASNGGKLKAGPVWDFDWAWKDIASCTIFEATDGSGWAHLINDCFTDNYSCGWYVRMLQDSTFNNELRCAYEGYRTNVLDTTFLFAYIDSVGDLVQNAQARHFQKWPILGVSGPAPEVNPVAITYAAELDTLKSWIARRLDWLDLNIPGQCTIQASVPERGGDQGLLIYPNPSNGAFHFQGTFTAQGPLQLSIHDLTWREIDRFTLPTGRVDIDHEIRESGTYFFTVRSQGRILRTGKLVVL